MADGGAAGRAAGGEGDDAFVDLKLRMARGRSAALHLAVDQALELATKALFPPLLASRHIGNTLQIDEGMELFDARNSALHPQFQAKA